MGTIIGVALDVLRSTFGHAQFRGLQAGVISEVLAGHNALAVLPTGGGKSLCSGVGQSKIQRYGAAVLELVREH